MEDTVQTQRRARNMRSWVAAGSLVLVIGITTLPTVFYFWDPPSNVNEQKRKPQNHFDPSVCNNGERVLANSLAASACSLDLNWSHASFRSLNDTRIISVLNCNFEKTEENLQIILSFLSNVADTSECLRHATPLVCHYLYQDCTVPALQPTSQDCLRVQDNVCREQWHLAAGLLRSSTLGSCVTIPDCDKDFSNSTTRVPYAIHNTSSEITSQNKRGDEDTSNFTCHPPLVKTELRNAKFHTKCSPSCLEETWTRPAEQVTLEVMLYLTAVVSLTCAVVAFITWAKVAELRQFPQSTLLFLVIAYFVAMIGFGLPLLVGRRRAYCSHKDMRSTWEDPSVLCKIQGALVHFGIVSALVWWLCSIFNVFVSVYVMSPVNPIRRYSKAIFLFETMLSVALPAGLVGTVLGVGGRYATSGVQVVSCAPPTLELVFFTMALPLQVVVFVGVVMTSLIVLRLRKVRENVSLKKSSSTAFATQTTIQTRFLMIIIFFPLCFGTIMSSIVVYDKLSEDIQSNYAKYVGCVNIKPDPAVCADRQHNYGSIIVCIIDLFMFDVFSVVMIAYVLAPSLARQFWMRLLRNIRQKVTVLITKNNKQMGKEAIGETVPTVSSHDRHASEQTASTVVLDVCFTATELNNSTTTE